MKNYVTLKIEKFGYGRTRCSLCLKSLEGLSEAFTHGCSMMEKEGISLFILLQYEKIRTKTK